MTEFKPRVRFAPSPTGELHVGNARTALFNRLFARHYGGTLVLRIEDTDQERTSRTFEKNLLEDLKWLSIDWDEGPGTGGSYGPYHQIERLDIYKDQLAKLKEADLIYPCYCTEEELDAERKSLLSRHLAPRYMGKCRRLTEERRRKLENQGRKPAWRFRIGSGFVTFNDLIRGAMKFDAEAIGDFIIVRSSGIPAYNFAVVIDDHLMAITHVIRGEDHLSNTAMQLLLYKALNFQPPEFAHHALILGKDRAKLSKRHGSVAVREFREKGILPEALINYLALLGGSIGEGREVCGIDEILGSFSLDQAGKSGAIFDEDKLRWMNAIYIRKEDAGNLADRMLPCLARAGYDVETMDRNRLESITDALRDNLVTLSDITSFIDIFFDDRYQITADALKTIESAESRPVLERLRDILSDSGEEISYQNITDKIGRATGLKGRKLLMPVRSAVTGMVKGPELDKVFSLLPRESLLKRAEKALALSTSADGREKGA